MNSAEVLHDEIKVAAEIGGRKNNKSLPPPPSRVPPSGIARPASRGRRKINDLCFGVSPAFPASRVKLERHRREAAAAADRGLLERLGGRAEVSQEPGIIIVGEGGLFFTAEETESPNISTPSLSTNMHISYGRSTGGGGGRRGGGSEGEVEPIPPNTLW